MILWDPLQNSNITDHKNKLITNCWCLFGNMSVFYMFNVLFMIVLYEKLSFIVYNKPYTSFWPFYVR